jgi:nicotinamide-nucleotide amidase
MFEPEDVARKVPIRAEIISVGTELLLGTIVDTNAAYLAQRLAGLGIDCYYVSAVGDNLVRLTETIARSFGRSDVVVCTGGLGPTGDDLTREAVAAVLDEEPYIVPELEAPLRAFFAKRGLEMPQRNVKQATLIRSARAITNLVGTAPGWWVETVMDGSTRTGIFMPGVPFEMKRMWEHEIEPSLRGRSGMVLVSRTLKVLGAGESAVEEQVADLMEGSNPTLAPYAKSDGIHLRMTAKSETEERARSLIESLEGSIRERLGDLIYGADADTPESATGALANALGLKYAVLAIGFGPEVDLLSSLVGVVGYTGGLVSGTLDRALGELGVAEGADIALAARALALRSGADLVLAVVADQAGFEGDTTVVHASVDARILSSAGVQLIAQRQSWRVPRTEVTRVARLLALNLLRRKLLSMQREGDAPIGA